jgi:hypothetical protein
MLVDYAKVTPWSVDDAYYMADNMGWYHLFARTSNGTYTYKQRLKTYSASYGSTRDYGSSDASFHGSLWGDGSNWVWANNPATPHVIYYTGSSSTNTHAFQLKAYDADTDTISVIHDFTPTIALVNSWGTCAHTATAIDNQREGNQSDDDRYWAFGVTDGTASGWCAVLVYDKTADAVVAVKTLGANGLCGTQGCAAASALPYPNWVGVSPSGSYVLFNWQSTSSGGDPGWTRGHGTEIFDRNLAFVGVASSGNGHGDVGYDANGVEIYVDRVNSNPITYGYYELEMCDLSKLSQTVAGPYKPDGTGGCQQYLSLPCAWYKAGDPAHCPGGSSTATYGSYFISMRGSHGAARGWMLFSSVVLGGPGYSLPTGNGGFGALENVAYKMSWADGSSFNNSANVPSAQFVRLGRHRAIQSNDPKFPNYNAQSNTAPNHDFTKFAWTSTWDVAPPGAPSYAGSFYSLYTELTAGSGTSTCP